jgi:hypothetical protein
LGRDGECRQGGQASRQRRDLSNDEDGFAVAIERHVLGD